MKTFYKVLIGFCLGICFIFVGVTMGGLSQVHVVNIFDGGFVWNADLIENVSFQSNEKVNDLKMNIFNANVNFVVTQEENVRVEATRVYEGFEVYQSGQSLTIHQSHYWEWFEHYEKSDVTVYIPSNQVIDYTELNVNAGNARFDNMVGKDFKISVGAGNLKLDGMTCESLSLNVGMGNANIDDMEFEKELDIDVGMGNTNLDVKGQQGEYNYRMKTGLGTVRIGSEKVSGIGKSESHHGTTSKNIDAKCGMGSIKVRMED